MTEEKKIKLDLYDISILEVLKSHSETCREDEHEVAPWKARITKEVAQHIKRNYKDTGKRGKGSDIHRSTVGRHIKKLLELGFIDAVFFPEGTNSYADKGYTITEKGKGYLEVVHGQGGLAREYGSLCMGNYILERHLDSCDMCDMDPEGCYDNVHTYLKDGLGISDDLVEEINDGGYELKDLKEAVDLILAWEYLREAIEHGKPDEGEQHKENKPLKLMAMRDPRIMEIVCNTYALPLRDVADIYVNWGLRTPPPIPMDHYLVCKELAEESEGLTAEEVRERLKDRGITYDPKPTLEMCVDGKWLMEKVVIGGEERYLLTKAGKRMNL